MVKHARKHFTTSNQIYLVLLAAANPCQELLYSLHVFLYKKLSLLRYELWLYTFHFYFFSQVVCLWVCTDLSSWFRIRYVLSFGIEHKVRYFFIIININLWNIYNMNCNLKLSVASILKFTLTATFNICPTGCKPLKIIFFYRILSWCSD